uniref:BZIP domain-containing protein n=1 Tax=Nelumbo nucifera TaxID=4432 RepID=A0A822YJM0_NELNU|nr:TPA_asm: hypothetical protein HUJ06_011154 [Nelumbo nucifera]
MGNAETDTPTKTPKSSSAQEQPPASSTATVFPDWASFQAYYNSAGTPPIPPPGFFHSPVASSPQAHPYMWGQGSHPYGPYAVPSPNGMAEASVPGAADGKPSEHKSKIPVRRSKGSSANLDMLASKNDTGKTSGASANGGLSQSAESGSDGSSEGSDANSQNGSHQKPSGEQGSADAGTQNGSTACSMSSRVTRTPPAQAMLNQSMVMAMPPAAVSGPTTNLNIGMDYWGAAAPSSSATTRAKLPVIPASTAIVSSNQIGSRDGNPEAWLQDERELKRQRRKQSNRESARRSRLRKQAECEELAHRVETLKEENSTLREELERLREECEKLASENASLTEKLKKYQGQESGADDLNSNPDAEPLKASNTESIKSDG